MKTLIIQFMWLWLAHFTTGKIYLVETSDTKMEPGEDYSADTTEELNETHAFGCPMEIECKKEGRLCMMETPYSVRFFVKEGLEYDGGRIKKFCRRGENICGISISNLTEKDIGNWRCGSNINSLKTLTVSFPKRKKNQCSTTKTVPDPVPIAEKAAANTTLENGCEDPEKPTFGCPLTLECEKDRRGNCIFETAYKKRYLINPGLDYEGGRIKSICRGENKCGISITDLQEKDIGDWRCGVSMCSLKTITVQKP